MRVARPTDDLEAAVEMYSAGLDFEVLGTFEDHEGFDGVMLGCPGAEYHLEFTRQRGHIAGRAPTQDHLLVFYVPDRDQWTRACARMEPSGFKAVPAYNPYWDREGRTFEDQDGYRIVLQNAVWNGRSDPVDRPHSEGSDAR